MTSRVLIGLGSNLGRKRANLQAALDRLAATPAIEVLAVSPLYRTTPVDCRAPGCFLNAAALLSTELAPHALLEVLLRTEAVLGRVRTYINAPRTIDLDILMWGSRVVRDAALTIPHPRLHERLFALAPLCDLAPALAHPVLGRTLAELRRARREPGAVRRVAGPEWYRPA